MLMHNPFMGQDEVIFITYDEIIRNPYPLLLQQVSTKYFNSYKDFLNMEPIKGLDILNLTRFCMQRLEKNPFKALAKLEFDYDGALKDLMDKFMDLYDKSDLCAIGKNLKFIAGQKFTKKIYIYTEKYDVRIHMDIQKTFNDMEKINYVNGSFEEVIENLNGVTTYILNDINLIPTIFENGKARYTSILLAMYGYNFMLDRGGNLVTKLPIESEYMKKVVAKFSTFLPIQLSDDHFTALSSKK